MMSGYLVNKNNKASLKIDNEKMRYALYDTVKRIHSEVGLLPSVLM